ncbi:MAG: hypothetical protein FJ255_02275 [Phycisphaerae bacterium]|nr:hypothetical protein [Phycisphaerae bacterium]
MTDAPARTIEVDLPCVRCRYLLRGVDARGQCPECALPIAESFDPRRLLLADRRWLRRRAIATTLTCLFPVFCFATFVVFVWSEAVAWMINLAAAMAVLLPIVILALAAAATAPDQHAGRQARVGRWIAVGAGAAMVMVCSTAPLWVALSPTLVRGWLVPVVAVFGSLAVIAGTGLVWSDLARRERLRSRARLAEAVVWLALFGASLLGLAWLAGAFGYWPAAEWVARIFGTVLLVGMAAVGLSWLIAGVLAARMLRRMRGEAVDPAALPSTMPGP